MDNERKLMRCFLITNAEATNHYHQNMEILYVMKGSMEVRIDDSVYHLKDNDFILINSNKNHGVSAKEAPLAARFVIDFHMLAEYMGTMQLMFWCNTTVDKNDAYQDVRTLLDCIVERYLEQDDKNELYLDSLYYKTLHLLTSNFMVKADDARLYAESTQDRIRVRQIQNYIQANYQSQISLNDLAKKLYLSNSYLSKYVKKHLGMTFLDYLNNVRLFHAVDELIYSNKSLTHIAMDNGFPTSAAFTKVFRDMHGEAPSEYRKRMRNVVEPLENKAEEERQKQQRIQEFLEYKRTQNDPEEKMVRECRADSDVFRKRNVLLNKAVNVGEAYSLLQSEVQNQLREIRQETGIIYARIWNLFSKENCIEGKQEYNFRNIDRVLDFMVENHMKPYIELGTKPSIFMYTPERMVRQDLRELETYNFEKFSALIKAFCMHLVNRYGVDEIESWIFEYWNDPKLHMTQEDGEYYPNFEMIYRTLKSISPEIKVGGAGFILGFETPVCNNIFRIWAKREIQPDFLSLCSYQYVALMEHGERYGRKSIDGHYMKNQVELLREVMTENNFLIPELHIDEWNFTVSNRNIINDSCGQGAYIMKNCIDMAGTVDFMAYWHGLDIYSDYHDSNTILNGDSGMISRDGIRKPSFYAFKFLDKLQPYLLTQDDNCIITTNRKGRYAIACHNYKRLASEYVFKEEDQIKVEELEFYMENTEPLKIKFTLDHVRNGTYQVKVYYVNKDNGNAQEIWRKMEYAKGLAKDEIEYIKKRSVPSMEMRTVQVDDGVLEFENTLQAQEIRLLDIQYRYDI